MRVNHTSARYARYKISVICTDPCADSEKTTKLPSTSIRRVHHQRPREFVARPEVRYRIRVERHVATRPGVKKLASYISTSPTCNANHSIIHRLTSHHQERPCLEPCGPNSNAHTPQHPTSIALDTTLLNMNSYRTPNKSESGDVTARAAVISSGGGHLPSSCPLP